MNGKFTGQIPMVRAPKFKPTRDIGINVRIVVCPICKAAEGEWCTKLDGPSRAQSTHISRRKMAIRKLNNDKSE
jgi:hypothetical protein